MPPCFMRSKTLLMLSSGSTATLGRDQALGGEGEALLPVQPVQAGANEARIGLGSSTEPPRDLRPLVAGKQQQGRLGAAAGRSYPGGMGKSLADRAAAGRPPRRRAGPSRQAELLILCARIGYNP